MHQTRCVAVEERYATPTYFFMFPYKEPAHLPAVNQRK